MQAPKFAVGERVVLKEHGKEGTVTDIMSTLSGERFYVVHIKLSNAHATHLVAEDKLQNAVDVEESQYLISKLRLSAVLAYLVQSRKFLTSQDSITVTEVYEDYLIWCEKVGVDVLPIPVFGREFEERSGLRKEKIAGRIRYICAKAA